MNRSGFYSVALANAIPTGSKLDATAINTQSTEFINSFILHLQIHKQLGKKKEVG
jgi:hypothetical protein